MDKIGEQTLKIMKKADWYNNWLFSLIKPYLKGDILEVGAGLGNFTSLLAKREKITTIDINENYIAKLKKIVGTGAGYGNIETGEYFFENKSFDSAICLNVIEHIKDDKRALRNINKLLEKKGKIIVLSPSHKWAYGTLDRNLGHERRYTKEELVEKFKNAGFNIVRVKYVNWLGLLGWYINGRLLKKKIIPKNQLGLFDKIARPILLFEKFVEPPFGLSILIVGEKR